MLLRSNRQGFDERTREKNLTLSQLYCVFQHSLKDTKVHFSRKIAISRKMDLLQIFFISISQNIVLFSRQSEMLASKQQHLGRKHGNFSYKCFSFHGLRKFVACIFIAELAERAIIL